MSLIGVGDIIREIILESMRCGLAVACRCHPLHLSLSLSLCWIPIKKLTKSPDTLPIIQRCSLSISISIFKS